MGKRRARGRGRDFPGARGRTGGKEMTSCSGIPFSALSTDSEDEDIARMVIVMAKADKYFLRKECVGHPVSMCHNEFLGEQI